MHKSNRCQGSKCCRHNGNISSQSSSHHMNTQQPCCNISVNSSAHVSGDDPCKHHHHHRCIPRFGELVSNGGFENPHNTFHDWVINSGVDVIDPGMGDTAHQGFAAARLGFIEPQARLYQDIPGICPGLFYQLSFFMSTAKDLCNASVNVRLEFLDKYKNPLGNPALDILIPQNSLYEAYDAFINNTNYPAPHKTHFVRVLFEVDTGADADGYVCLDDVSLAALEGKVHI